MKNVFKWIKQNILNKETLVFFIFAEIIFWSPLIFSLVMTVFNSWWWTGVIGVLVFWAGPFTPAIPIQIGLTLLLKKMFTKKVNK